MHEGDWIGLGDSRVISIADSIAAASNELLDRADPSRARALDDHRRRRGVARQHAKDHRVPGEVFPQISVEVHHGGQPLYPYYFGLE